jgi:quinol monooxygenase YgiN
MREVFVYFKVTQTQAPLVAQAVRAMQGALRSEHPGLSTRLLTRDEEGPHEQATLMEIYAHERGIDAGLQAEISAAATQALKAWPVGQRHVEVFHPLD